MFLFFLFKLLLRHEVRYCFFLLLMLLKEKEEKKTLEKKVRIWLNIYDEWKKNATEIPF